MLRGLVRRVDPPAKSFAERELGTLDQLAVKVLAANASLFEPIQARHHPVFR